MYFPFVLFLKRKVEELIRRKVAKEAAVKEFQNFIKLLGSAKSMPSHDKPSKSSWKDDEKIWSRIESLEAYAIDACISDKQRETAGIVIFCLIVCFDFLFYLAIDMSLCVCKF